MPRRNMRSFRPASQRHRRAMVPPDVPVRSLDPSKSDYETGAVESTKPEAQRDTVDDNIRRMIEAAYT
jgi:hypothetical protein